jgi:hypothetical protein
MPLTFVHVQFTDPERDLHFIVRCTPEEVTTLHTVLDEALLHDEHELDDVIVEPVTQAACSYATCVSQLKDAGLWPTPDPIPLSDSYCPNCGRVLDADTGYHFTTTDDPTQLIDRCPLPFPFCATCGAALDRETDTGHTVNCPHA